MRTTRRRLGSIIGALALIAGGCGGADDTAPDTAPDETVAEPDDSDAEVLTPQEQVLAAFADVGAGGGLRVRVATAQTYRLPALGVDTSSEIDLDRPLVTTEVAADGSVHQYLDMGPFLAVASGGDPTVAAALDTVHAEIWVAGDRMVIDATGYQPLADLNPTYPLGPFSPGVGEVDLTALGDDARSVMIQALVGTVIDPTVLAVTLPVSLAGIATDPADPTRFTATVPYDVLIAAQGGDPDLTFRTIAASLAPSLGVPIDDLASFYAAYFATVEVDVELVIVGGSLSSITTNADLSGVYAAMLENSPLTDVLTPADLADAAVLFSGAVQTVRTVTVFAADDTVTVVVPEGEFEDRTEAALAYLDLVAPA